MRIYPLVCALLFALSKNDAERAHTITLHILEYIEDHPHVLQLIQYLRKREYGNESVNLCGIDFANRLGLPAGFVKNFECLQALAALLGVGHIEGGTVVPQPQAGDARPRVYRLEKDELLLNHMAFPSEGAEAARLRLKAYRKEGGLPVRIGINISKQTSTPPENAADDFLYVQQKLVREGDYLTLNISSPNSPGLTSLQKREYAEVIIHGVVETEKCIRKKIGLAPRPVFVKKSPDLDDAEIMNFLEAVVHGGASGVVNGNTTISRPSWFAERYPHLKDQRGGLSGWILEEKKLQDTELIKTSVPNLIVIDVGGNRDGASVRRALNAGADLIQSFTALIFGGPAVFDLMRKACV